MSDQLQRITYKYCNNVPDNWLDHVYDYNENCTHFPFGLAREFIIKKVLKTYYIQNRVAYDFGCGGGQLTKILAENDFFVYGLDFSEKMLLQAAELININNLNSNVVFIKAEEDGFLPENSCVLTFDDGNIGQYLYALPILLRYDLKAFFFVPTCILDERIIPIVEKQRLLQYGKMEYSDFYSYFCKQVNERCPYLPSHEYVPSPYNLENSLGYFKEYNFYTPMERLYRKVRDKLLTGKEFEDIITQMFSLFYDESELIGKLFMNIDNITKLKEAGMEIGGHGHLHLIDTTVPVQVAVNDVQNCLDFYKSRLNIKVRSYVYPYGVFIPEVIDVLKDRGVSLGFTCQSGVGYGENYFKQT